MKEIKYSIIMLVNNYNNITKSLSSIAMQKYDLKKVELFIIDISNDKEEIINDFKDKINIVYKSVDDTDKLVEIYNSILKKVNGEVITFTNCNSYYDNANVLSHVEKLIKKHNLVSIKSSYYDTDNNVTIDYKIQPKKTMLVDLTDDPFLLSLNINSYFISADILKEISFCGRYFEDAEKMFVIDILKQYPKYFYINKLATISYDPYETNSSKCSIQYNKWWYIDSLNQFIEYAKKMDVIPPYIQEIFLYIIYAKINCNIYDRNKGILNKDEINVFFDCVVELSRYIDNEILLQYKYNNKQLYLFTLPRWFKYYILNKKMGIKNKLEIKRNRIFIEYKDNGQSQVISNSDVLGEHVKIYAINYVDGKLYFDCTTSLKDVLNEDEFKIYVKYNGQKIEVTRSYFYPLLKVFGHTLSEKYCFNFAIDIGNRNGEIEIFASINGKDIPLNLSYAKVQARLSNSKRSFWHYKDFVLYNRVNKIDIRPARKLELFKSELLFDLSKLKNVNNKYRALKLIFIRLLYYITKPFYKNKHIWLTWDKLYKAGDNGEYMYQYCLKNNRNIYYFIKKDSPDYERLKKQNTKRCVVFNSLKAKMLSLHSEVILDTHANVISYCGFDGISRHFVCGLFNPEIICIQHGLTIQKIAQYQNRLFDNIKYYCCASQFEIDNIKAPIYDYREEQMSLTGLARYDGLKSKAEKLVLITPTWRRNVVNSSIAYVKKKHNNNFKHSDYFNIYNSLINNTKLINCAKECGYKLVYLLHPAMSGQLEDFGKNDFVDIIPATGNVNYEDILTRAALMVTDYSGVQFDFAYQRKVLVYYHPDALPPHYDAGGLDYETMGFGPICKTEEQIVDELCENMRNGCVIKDLYKKRADDFFAFDDFNNCERILKAVDTYLEKIGICDDNYKK